MSQDMMEDYHMVEHVFQKIQILSNYMLLKKSYNEVLQATINERNKIRNNDCN